MKKKAHLFASVDRQESTRLKILRIMKLTALLLTIAFLQASAGGNAQSITLTCKDIPLRQFFKVVEDQTGYVVMGKKGVFSRANHVSISVVQKPLHDVLDLVMKNQPLRYIILDKTIILTDRNDSPEPAQSVELPKPESFDPPPVISVSGSVVDSTGAPLEGVSVLEKGTNNGTSTNANGLFNIEVTNNQSVLVFSRIGFASLEQTVGNKTSFVIVLRAEDKISEEVIVVGYGTQRRSDLTGSIGTLTGDRVAERNIPQVSQALQGQIAGLTVTRSGSAPGAASTLRIRGVTTIGDSDPLILIDGVPASSIDNVHPADIENISVLKDAASASIYGSKAAAGVILVTTKKGSRGKTSLDFTYNIGSEKPSNLPEYANVIRYMEMVNELQWNDINNPTGGEYPVYTKDVIDNYYSLNADNPDLYPNTDWQDVLLKDQAMRQNLLLNISGGTDKVQTRITLGYDRIGGLYIGKKYQRLTARVNTNITVTDKIKSSVNVYFKRAISENPSESPMTNVYRSAPVYAAVWTNGLIAEGKSGNNMYAQLLQGGFNNGWSNQLGARASLDYQPIRGMTLSAVVAPVMNFNKDKEFRKKVQYTNFDDPSVYAGTTDWGKSNSLLESRLDNYNLTAQLLATYNKRLGLHSFDVLGGYEYYYLFQESMSAFSDNLQLDSYPYLDLRNDNFLRNTGNAFEYASNSFFGRLGYNFNRKYLFQANLRVDGSSRFHEDYRWGLFPSFSAGWVISQEDFFPQTDAISNLKLRASYGVLGNERIGNYPYQATINFARALLYQGNDIVSVQTAAQQAYAIPDISWETTTSYNVGLDMTMFDNRLNVNFDYYRKNTKDMLLTLEIPGYMGYANPDQNAGKMHTNGWELVGRWSDNIGKLKYSISANLSDARSVIDDLSGIQFLGDQVKIAGSEFNEWFGYRSLGIFQTKDDVDKSPVLNAGLAPGDLKYADISGPDGVPDGKISEYDKVPLGGSLPRYIYGGNIELNYGNFDFSVSFQGVAKQKARLTANMVQAYQGSWGNMPLEIDGKYWSVYNTPEQNLAAQYPRLSNKFTSNNYAMSDFWLFDGSYFRVKTIILGYTIPERLLGKAGIKGARVYVSGIDLLTINKYPRGWDPELSNTGYPITSSVNAGISLKF